jgi:hypothetical protein
MSGGPRTGGTMVDDAKLIWFKSFSPVNLTRKMRVPLSVSGPL